jgi:hypothetical protein
MTANMRAFNLFLIAAIVSLVASDLAPPSPESNALNASALEVVHISAVSDADWNNCLCRDRKLFLAITRDSTQGTRYINPLTTPWQGDLVQEMEDWTWDCWNPEDSWCKNSRKMEWGKRFTFLV